MSIGGLVGFAPVNLTFPVTVAPPWALPAGCRVQAASATTNTAATTAAREPNLRIVPPWKSSCDILLMPATPAPAPPAPRACPPLGAHRHQHAESEGHGHGDQRGEVDSRRRRVDAGRGRPRG